MKQRINYAALAPKAMKIMQEMEGYISNSSLETSLIELVKLRVSQINACAFCIDMHTKDARNAGETEQRLYTLSAWRETTFYSVRERAALAWTEALTLIAENTITDALYNSVKEAFNEQEIVELSHTINTINSWNRLAISFRTPAGSYNPTIKK